MTIPVLVSQVILAVASQVIEAIDKGSVSSLLDKPLRDILPTTLRTSLAKAEADEAAAKKFH